MNSPPFHYPYHHLHDPTIINVHTLLKPQPYQQPTYITHNQEPLPPHNIPATPPPNFPPNTISILKQILQSQEECLHSMSLCTDMVSTITNSVAFFNTTHITHTKPKQNCVSHTSSHYQQPLTQQQQPNISYTPFNHQSPPSFSPNLQTHSGYEEPIQQPPPSLHNTQHSTLTTVPSTFNQSNTHTTPKQIYHSHKYIKQQPSNIFTPLNHHSVTKYENTFHSQEAILTAFSKSPLVAPKIDDEIISIISPSSQPPHRFIGKKTHITKLVTRATERKAKTTVLAVTKLVRSSNLCGFSIFNFDPGGTFKVTDWSAVLHHLQIRRFSGFTVSVLESLSSVAAKHNPVKFIAVKRRREPAMVSFPVWGVTLGAASGRPWVPWSENHSIPRGFITVFDPGGDNHIFLSPMATYDDNCRTLSLLWLPWDRGKSKVWNGIETHCMGLGLKSSISKMGLEC